MTILVQGTEEAPHGFRARIARWGVLSAIAVLTLNLWTGGPMLALWIGSRVQGSGPTSIGAVGIVIALLGGISWAIIRALASLHLAYERLTDRPHVRHRTAWLRSIRGERSDSARSGVSAADVVVIAIVVAAIVAFEIWFLFFAGSPIDQRSGRG
jgi:hypothetical protein